MTKITMKKSFFSLYVYCCNFLCHEAEHLKCEPVLSNQQCSGVICYSNLWSSAHLWASAALWWTREVRFHSVSYLKSSRLDAGDSSMCHTCTFDHSLFNNFWDRIKSDETKSVSNDIAPPTLLRPTSQLEMETRSPYLADVLIVRSYVFLL